MKVNVSYSVAVEEVLDTIQEIYNKNKIKFEEEYKNAQEALAGSFTDEKLQSALLNFKKIRVAMAEYDIKLEELNAMAAGYQKLLNGQFVNPPPDATPEADAVSDTEQNERATD